MARSGSILMAWLALAFGALAGLTACREEPPPAPRRLSPAAENRLRGERHMAENAAKAGVITTASGLQYRVLKPGTGASPTRLDSVTVHYRGRFIDGTEFETSRDRGEAPVLFPVGRVIRGWQEGLQLMQVGATYEFTVPSQLAYGLDGSPPNIGPNQTLVFEIELLGIARQ